MKTISNFKKIALFVVITCISLSCSVDDNDVISPLPPSKSITQIAAANPNLKLLVRALTNTELASLLEKSGNYTVFAPDDKAFEKFLNGRDIDKIDDSVMIPLLLNHVISGSGLKSGDLKTGYYKSSSVASFGPTGAIKNPLSLYINATTGVKINNISGVTTKDIPASNGIIHIVDAVITLPTILNHITANPDFSSLVTAVNRPDQADVALALAKPENAPFTIFAPINKGFDDLLKELSLANLEAVPGDVLTKTLKYHVVTGKNVLASTLADDQKVTTFLEQDFTIKIIKGKASILDANGKTSEFIDTDIQCIDGVIHSVSKVLTAK
jgi:uncharacterized surface protein with fasciclin (FAS1) repeats